MKKAKRKQSSSAWLITTILLLLAVGVVWWSHSQLPLRSRVKAPATLLAMQDVEQPANLTNHKKATADVRANRPVTATPNQKDATPNQKRTKTTIPTPSADSGFEPPLGGVIDPSKIELPRWGDSETPIYNSVGRYWFVYVPHKRTARWVAYKLTRSDVKGGATRSNSFTSDPLLVAHGWQSASNSDYARSGYDKGHLLPSADRSGSQQENRATFRFSNIAPQTPMLNRGPWRLLEEELRRRTVDYDTIYVVVGSTPDTRAIYPSGSDTQADIKYDNYTANRESGRTIGRDVEVPQLFYKVIALRKGGDFVPQAYVMSNLKEGLSNDFRKYSVSVDSVERLTGIDFFPTQQGF